MSAHRQRDSNAPLRVCFLGSGRYSQPLDSTEAKKWRLLSGMPDCEIRVIGFADSLRPRRFVQHVEFLLLPQMSVSLLRYATFFKLAPWLLGWLAMRGRADIIVAQSPYEGAVGALVKRVAGIFGRRTRLVIENHNNFEEDLFLQRRLRLPRLYRVVMLAFARYAFRHADALRVISASTAQQAQRYAPHLPQARFMAYSDAEAFKTARRLPVEEAVDIVYAGVLIPRKGVHHLLNAFARLDHPRAQLHLVGKAENAAYAADLRAQAQSLGIAERVNFVGAVTQSELAEYFAAARAMALPSLSEGLGRVVVEAMLAGAPVIGSRVGGIPDLIEDGVNGLLFEPGDEDDLLRALRGIYAADVQSMGANARDFAQRFFSPQQYAAAYRQLFDLALGHNPARDEPRRK